jgi:predicted phosphodiesterase
MPAEPGSTEAASVTPSDFKVAMFGDSTLSEDAAAVFRLVRDEGTQMVLHLGDFDYENDPAAWEAMIDRHLGPDFPFFAVGGNHDLPEWNAYQARLERRLQRTDASCEGELGVQAACHYRGLFFILAGVGGKGASREPFIRAQLERTTARWRLCIWHRPHRSLQVSRKWTGAPMAEIEACREGGAIVVAGHSHTYSRTHLLSDFDDKVIASTSTEMEIGDGNSVALVSGLGGRKMYRQRSFEPWFAVALAKNRGAEFGALFCDFGAGGDPTRANCYFKDIRGEIRDRFTLVSQDR